MTSHRPYLIAMALASLTAASFILASFDAHAQTRPARARPVAVAQPVAEPPPVQKCLRALNGVCTNVVIAEAAAVRSIIVPSVRVSYFGTPAGTIGGDYIPFERFFRDNDIVFGLPTVTCTTCNVVRRTK